MKVTIEIIKAGFFFNKNSSMHPETPLINVIWVENGMAHGAIETIEYIFDPLPENLAIPEEVRLEVIRKYENKLKPYLQ
tara:strand:+ start:902 stop:1138 length:237 start_codon:yes stop_codon:yes gene_type:complete